MSVKIFPRSSYDKIGGLVYFRRMADKARLHAAGRLPDEYVPLLGGTEPTAFDGRCCRFLHIDYDAFVAEVKKGRTDDELLVWSMNEGRDPLPPEKEAWNGFMRKRGWRDEAAPGLRQQVEASGLPGEVTTFFDLFDAEEGRSPRHVFGSDAHGPLPVRPLMFPDLRSCYETVGGIAHFGRMLDKIRLHRKGNLPSAWQRSRGGITNYDGLCCQFLGVPYAQLEERTLAEKKDEEVLEWALSTGTPHTPEEIKIWNVYLAKRNWRDEYTPRLHYRLQEFHLSPSAVPTMFDYIDLDEGRLVRPLEMPLPF